MQVKASHILVGSEEKAKQLYEEIISGADFSKLAMDNSKCPSGRKGGNLGFFKRGQMVREFENFCFANKKGTVGIVKTEFGWHVIKVTDVNKKG
jgi:peptidyl-prolyl cis-trans isomerase C